MPPDKMPLTNSSKIDVIATQVEYLVKTFDELRAQMNEFEDKRTAEWVEYKVEHAKVVDITNKTESRIQFMEVDTKTKFARIGEDLDKLKESVAPLVAANKIVTWIGGILGASVIIFIWSIITHAVTITTH